MCHFVVVFFSPFSIAITSLGEERAYLSRTFVRFGLVWICRFPLTLGVWEVLRFVIVALPGLFSYFLFCTNRRVKKCKIPSTKARKTDQNKTFFKIFYPSQTCMTNTYNHNRISIL